MAISVIKKKGINPNTGADLWRIQWTREDTVDEKKLAKTMARGGTYSVGECSGVLLDFPQYFVDELLNGNAVKIDGLGTFKLRVTAPTNADPEKLSTRGAKVTMVLDADPDLLSRLNTEAQFKIVTAPTAEGQQDADTDEGSSSEQEQQPSSSAPVLTVTKTGTGTMTVTDQTGHQIESGAAVTAGQTLTIAVTPAGSATPTATIGSLTVTLTEDEGQWVGTFQMPASSATLTVRTGGTGDNEE